MPADSGAGVANSAATRIGVAATVSMLRLACATEQSEQAWWDAVESSGWVCTACTTPIAHTSTIARMHTTLTKTLRFLGVLLTILRYYEFDPVAI